MAITAGGLLNHGVQARILKVTTAGAGTTTRDIAVQTDSVLVTLFVSSVVSGTLTVSAHALAGDDDGEESQALFTFPSISAPTGNLLLKAGTLTTQRIRLKAVHTGICTFEIQARAINGGATSTKILGSESLRMSSVTVGVITGILIPAALTDRTGIVIKNWSQTQTIYLGASPGEASIAAGYPLAPKDGLALDIAAGVTIYAVADIAGADIRIAESGQ